MSNKWDTLVAHSSKIGKHCFEIFASSSSRKALSPVQLYVQKVYVIKSRNIIWKLWLLFEAYI